MVTAGAAADPPYSISISATSQGSGFVTLGEGAEPELGAFLGTQRLRPNGSTKIRATPQPEWYFKGYQGAGNSNPRIDVTNATQDVSVTAEFKRNVTIATEVRTATDTSAGSDPPECAGYIQLEPEAKSYAPGTTVDISAVPFQDCCWALDSWEIKMNGAAYVPILTASTLSFTIQEDKDIELVAIFKKKYDPWEIKLIAANQGLIDIAKQAIDEWNDEMQRDEDGTGVEDVVVCKEYVVVAEEICSDIAAGPNLLVTAARDLLYNPMLCGYSDWNLLIFGSLQLNENGPGEEDDEPEPWMALALLNGARGVITTSWPIVGSSTTPTRPRTQSEVSSIIGHELGHMNLPDEDDESHGHYEIECVDCSDSSCTTPPNNVANWRTNVMGICKVINTDKKFGTYGTRIGLHQVHPNPW